MSLDLGELSIALNLDKDGFARGLAEARAELETLPDTAQREIRNVTRTFDAGGKDAGGKFGESFTARVKASLKALPPAELDLNDEAAQAKLDWLREELKGLSSQRVGVDISDTDAVAKLTAIRAELDNLAARSPSVQVKADTRAAAAEIDRFLGSTQAKAEVAGEVAGNTLARGMAQGAGNSSPLIMAAITGGLTAGAPALLGTAGSIFIAIAALAVHSNETMQDAFDQTKDTITSTFTDAAQVTVPFFVRAMQRIGDAAHQIGPQLQSAFASLGGPIDSLTTGIIQLEQNAMPGLVAAVRSVSPVFDGLKNLLADIGTGLGQMFSIISQHTAAAGSVLSDLGQVIQAMLPALGELLGAGAELASHVLPPLAAAMKGVGDALAFVSPVLPAVLAGFLAFKAVGFLAPMLAGVAAKMELTAINAGVMTESLTGSAAAGSAVMTGMGRVGGSIGAVGRALPLIGAAVVGLGLAFEAASQQTDDWATALNDGGSAAAQAREQMRQTQDFVTSNTGIGATSYLAAAWDALKGQLTGSGAAAGFAAVSLAKTSQAQKDQLAGMSPLESAQQAVTKAQNDYLEAVNKYGPASGQAAGAAVTYRDAMQGQKDTEDQLSLAIHGVTQAMQDQANEALAAADSGFAYQSDVLATKDAESALTDAIKQHGSGSEDAQKATIALGQALLTQASAAGKLAADQSGLTDQTDLTKVAQQATLAELLKLKAQYGTEFPASLQATIDKLQAAGVGLDDVGAKKPTPQVKLDDSQFNSVLGFVNGAIKTLHGQKPTPTAFLNKEPFGGAASSMDAMLSYLASRHIKPSATLIAYTLAAEQALDNAARNRTSYVTQYYVSGGVGSVRAQAAGGILHAFAAGGFEPMAGGTAEIVAPGTKRIIGDRIADDEAYIPINDSARSLSILAQTANRMGYSLEGMSRAQAAAGVSAQAATSGGVDSIVRIDNYHAAPSDDPNETARKLAVLARTGGAG